MNIQIELDNLYELTHEQQARILRCAINNVLSFCNENGVVGADEIESQISATIDYSVKSLAQHKASPVELDWAKAKQHFDDLRQQYQELEGTPGVNTTLALRAVFDPLAKRFNAGERTPELHKEMLELK